MKENKTHNNGPIRPTVELVTLALKEAARDAEELHRRLGLPLVVWEDGKVAYIPAEELDANETGKEPIVRRAAGIAKKKPKLAKNAGPRKRETGN